MSDINFKSLQNLHESLLQKQQGVTEENQQDFAKEVRGYIEQAKRGGSNISSTRERDQIRANLRYWANYIYAIDKTFPDTELAPSTVSSRPISAPTIIVLVIVGIVIAILASFRIFAPGGTSEIETPSSIPIIASPTIVTSATVQAAETPTSVFVGSDVVLTSPENGESVLPKIVFKGAYTNLKAGSTIHMLLIRSDRLYPIKDFVTIPPDAATGAWQLPAALYLKPEELEKAETLAVVPGACFDKSCQDTLAASANTGLTIDELPSQLSFTLYRDSSRVVYRNAYHAIQEVRLVYPKVVEVSPNDRSYDLFTSKPDGSDERRITAYEKIDEKSPNLSPDGTKIVYVQVVRSTNAHSIHIMDSNGQNDHEIISGDRNTLENPQWSPDLSYISYALGDPTQSPNATYWSIHTYNLLTEATERISGEPAPNILNRYHSWIPNSTDIVFNAGTANTGQSGFIQASIDAPEDYVLYFDTAEEEVQPNIRSLENGYLLTYTVISPAPGFDHNIYAVSDSDQQLPFDGTPIRLTRTSGGSDHPIMEPNSNVIFYVRTGTIYKVEFRFEGSTITLIQGTNLDDGEFYGDLVIDTGTVTDNPMIDIDFMDAFFPIE